MSKIDLTAIAADLAAHRAEAEGYLRRAGIHQIDTRTTVRVLDPEGWEALDRWVEDLFARAVEAARADLRKFAQEHPPMVAGAIGHHWPHTYEWLRPFFSGEKEGEVCEATGLPWRIADPVETEKVIDFYAGSWQQLAPRLTFGEGYYGPPSVRDRQEHPAGRWQSDLWRVTVNPSPAEWYPRVDERDLALPGEFALSWRAPHQTAPMWGVGEPLGRVFESEEGHITVFLRADALEVLGISLEEVVAYAQGATGNY